MASDHGMLSPAWWMLSESAMSEDLPPPPRGVSRPAKKPRHSLQQIDGGRARRGLLILAACLLFWALLAWLWLHA